eukprot:scaffold35793_cov124-Isochrysis_galbana.AAC.4
MVHRGAVEHIGACAGKPLLDVLECLRELARQLLPLGHSCNDQPSASVPGTTSSRWRPRLDIDDAALEGAEAREHLADGAANDDLVLGAQEGVDIRETAILVVGHRSATGKQLLDPLIGQQDLQALAFHLVGDAYEFTHIEHAGQRQLQLRQLDEHDLSLRPPPDLAIAGHYLRGYKFSPQCLRAAVRIAPADKF